MSNTATPTNNVTIYGAVWCGWCPVAKKYFDKLGISYKYHDVEEEEDVAKELMEKLGGPIQGVPVIEVNGELIYGYDVEKINGALKPEAK